MPHFQDKCVGSTICRRTLLGKDKKKFTVCISGYERIAGLDNPIFFFFFFFFFGGGGMVWDVNFNTYFVLNNSEQERERYGVC